MIELMKETAKLYSEWSIYGEIEDFAQFQALIQALYEAEEGDYMLWNLNSPGGACDVGQALIAAMARSKAYVHCHVEANCYSMASMLALCGDKLSFNRNTFLMFHDYSTSYGGKGSDIGKNVEFERQVYVSLFKEWCCPFLTDKEFTKMMNGDDLYLRWDDKTMPARLKRHFV